MFKAHTALKTVNSAMDDKEKVKILAGLLK
jgi:hypothetical protein